MVAKETAGDSWVMDRGCTFHMTSHKEFFKSLKIEDLGSDKMGDDRSCAVQGLGVIKLSLNNEVTIELPNVRYITQLTKNLISLGTFEKEGCSVSLRNGKAKVVKGSMVIMFGTRSINNLYLLDGKTNVGHASVVESNKVKPAMLWHRRMGHMSGQGLKELNKEEVLGPMADWDFGFFEHV